MKAAPDHRPDDGARDRSADRRTSLAVERTELAWWRTGLTALAVAIGIRRVVPELSDTVTRWPYAVVGVGFAAYGIALFVRGTLRARERDRSRIAGADLALAVAGPVLGLLVIVLVTAN
jgi:putative membrane protein